MSTYTHPRDSRARADIRQQAALNNICPTHAVPTPSDEGGKSVFDAISSRSRPVTATFRLSDSIDGRAVYLDTPSVSVNARHTADTVRRLATRRRFPPVGGTRRGRVRYRILRRRD